MERMLLLQKLGGPDIRFRSYLLLIISSLLAAGITMILYRQTQEIMKSQLKSSLIGIVTTGTLKFNAEDLNKIINENSVEDPSFIRVTEDLQLIRNYNPDIKFAYILRPTINENIFHFVADADSIDPNAKVDLNNDGIIDDEDALVWPGEEYDVSDNLTLKTNALLYPTTDEEPILDQWGATLSAYAPIKNNGETIAILGIDVEVSDYLSLIRQTLIPFILFVVFLLLLLCVLTFFLVRIWKSRVEVLREIDRQKDELLSIVSHQLATPVSSVKWYLEMLLDGDVGALSNEQKEYLNTMQSVTYNLADLVSMILDVSRIQLGKMKVDAQPLDLNLFFKEILFAIEPKAKEKEQKFDVSIPNDLPKAMLDKRLTRMTIENLLSNAVKYTPAKGTVKWFMELRGTMLYMEVRDTGCGIPEKDQKQIFGKLFRASNTGAIDGNGFGLYVAKGAIEAQGGSIWFESKENKGTTFFVELPLNIALKQ